MGKKNIILAILLICQVLIITSVYWPNADSTAASTTFFSDLKVEDISKFIITDEENKTIAIENQNGNWVIAKENYPADSESINSILTKITSLQSNRLVTQTKSSQGRLKVAKENFNRKLVLELKNGGSKTFYLGSAPNSKSIHFRLEEENKVFLVKDLSSWELQTDKESWWQTSYIDFSKDELKSIKISNQFGDLEIISEDDNKWSVRLEDEAEVNSDKAEDLATSLLKLSLSEYIGKEKPSQLGEPICTVQYFTKSGSNALKIWAENEENGDNLIKSDDSDYYVKIKSYVLKDSLNAKITEFIKLPSTQPVQTESTTTTM